MMHDKKAEEEMLGKETVTLLLSVLAAIVIIAVIVGLLGLFSKKGSAQKAESEIEAIIGSAQTGLSPHLVTSLSGKWYLYNYEDGLYCAGNFCLCICDNLECSNIRKCKPTEKFFALKQNGRDSRFVILNEVNGEVTSLDINLKEGEVYPFSEVFDIRKSLTPDNAVSPVYYRFNSGWEWSLNLNDWFKTSDSDEVARAMDYGALSKADSSIIARLSGRTSLDDGVKVLLKSKNSDGVYIVEVK